jgi:hypothetical protein
MVELRQAPTGTHRKEVGGFLVVGVLAVILDFVLFNALLLVGWPVWAANAVALLRLHDLRLRRQLQVDLRPPSRSSRCSMRTPRSPESTCLPWHSSR